MARSITPVIITASTIKGSVPIIAVESLSSYHLANVQRKLFTRVEIRIVLIAHVRIAAVKLI